MAFARAQAQDAPIAKTEFGSAKGKISSDAKVNIFLGMLRLP